MNANRPPSIHIAKRPATPATSARHMCGQPHGHPAGGAGPTLTGAGTHNQDRAITKRASQVADYDAALPRCRWHCQAGLGSRQRVSGA